MTGLDFDWGGEDPIPGINGYNFSVRIEGLIKVTSTGKYLFKIESDGNTSFYFMDRKIITKDQNDISWEGDGSSTF